MIFQENQQITRTRTVEVTPDARVIVTDELTEEFIGRVYPPSESRKVPNDDSSPRSWLPAQPLWFRPGRLDSAVNAGDRFEADGVEYEALTPEWGKRAGLQVIVNEVKLVPTTGLYPILAELRELGGVHVMSVPISTWTSFKLSNTKGFYEDLAGEAPCEFYDELNVTNRELKVGDRVMRISRAQMMTQQPHVRLTMRSSEE